ncbi:UDP-glucose 4-epimerase [Vogesella perlucida]|nr:UDP-glucose 4-epimerase [Vogesella perlucida]
MILVTGGAGYIGSHTCLQLLQAGHDLVVLDNLSNSQPEALRRVQKLAGRQLQLVEGDIRDQTMLDAVFRYPVKAVIHFAGLKAVGESVAEPLRYYDNNVAGTLSLLKAMKKHGCQQLVFSSSATVYGDPASVPIREHFPLSATTPYGRSKLMIEDMLRDLAHAEPDWRIAILRYFKPVGAHASGQIGEDPNGIPNNLMPFISQVAVGKRAQLSVFGDDYPTHDGTGVRDYIHVEDLARGHLCALAKLQQQAGLLTVNLGTGQGYSVLDMVKAFEQASGRPVPYSVTPRRPGDVAACYADPAQAEQLLGWRAEKTLADMCADSWRWQSQNPNGYSS